MERTDRTDADRVSDLLDKNSELLIRIGQLNDTIFGLQADLRAGREELGELRAELRARMEELGRRGLKAENLERAIGEVTRTKNLDLARERGRTADAARSRDAAVRKAKELLSDLVDTTRQRDEAERQRDLYKGRVDTLRDRLTEAELEGESGEDELGLSLCALAHAVRLLGGNLTLTRQDLSDGPRPVVTRHDVPGGDGITFTTKGSPTHGRGGLAEAYEGEVEVEAGGTIEPLEVVTFSGLHADVNAGMVRAAECAAPDSLSRSMLNLLSHLVERVGGHVEASYEDHAMGHVVFWVDCHGGGRAYFTRGYEGAIPDGKMVDITVDRDRPGKIGVRVSGRG